MKHVDPPPAPPSLSAERANAERTAAEEFYRNWDGQSKFDRFAAYKAPDVRAALEAAFGRRCAYCESDYDKTQPMAVEHYRPKGEVTINGVRTPPGYYWLASEWTNLLPSCTDCNSPRRQDLPGMAEVAGKANAFPIASENKRATRPGEEKEEGRLLLHPYFDHPEKHIEFVWDNPDWGWIQPKRNGSGRPSAKGAKTIQVCALQRKGLIRARKERIRSLVSALESVVEAKGNVARYPADPEFKKQFDRRLDEVVPYARPDAEFSAMARQIIDAYHARLFGN
jgi:uncharacterized protein (TIGR02646 family)